MKMSLNKKTFHLFLVLLAIANLILAQEASNDEISPSPSESKGNGEEGRLTAAEIINLLSQLPKESEIFSQIQENGQQRFPWFALASAALSAFGRQNNVPLSDISLERFRRESGIPQPEVSFEQEFDAKRFPWEAILSGIASGLANRENEAPQVLDSLNESSEEGDQKRFPWGAIFSGIASGLANREDSAIQAVDSLNESSGDEEQKRFPWGAIFSGIANGLSNREDSAPQAADSLSESSGDDEHKRFPWGAILSGITNGLANRDNAASQTSDLSRHRRDSESLEQTEEKRFPWGMIMSGLANGLANRNSDVSDDAENPSSDEIGEEQPQSRFFFHSLYFSTCDYSTQAGTSCASCTVSRRCMPSNVAIQKRCHGLFRYCNNGRCSLFPGEACTSTSSTSSTSSSTSSTPSSTSSTTSSTSSTTSSTSSTTSSTSSTTTTAP